MKKYFLPLLVLFLSSCASQPSSEEISRLKSQNYGEYPKNYDEIIRHYVVYGNSYANKGMIPELIITPGEDNLKGQKIEYMFEPKKDYRHDIYGYGVCAMVPGTAAFGIKTKYLWYFLIVNGQVVAYEKPGGDSFSMGYISGLCNGLKDRTYL